jgi:hypothetical protein
VRTSWYCGIVLSLFSILSAADQTVRLHRLSSHRDGLANIRRLLARNGKGSRASHAGPAFQPSLVQIMTWQMPVMFLTSATLCMVVGMFLHVWSATKHQSYLDFSDDHSKVGIPWTSCSLPSTNHMLAGRDGIHGCRLSVYWHFLYRTNLSLLVSSKIVPGAPSILSSATRFRFPLHENLVPGAPLHDFTFSNHRHSLELHTPSTPDFTIRSPCNLERASLASTWHFI